MMFLSLIIIKLLLGSKFNYAEFQYSNVFYRIGYALGEWINLTTTFSNVKTDAMSEPIPSVDKTPGSEVISKKKLKKQIKSRE